MKIFLKNRNLIIGGYLILMTLMFSACVEPFDIKTETFESALVIEGTITDKMETQQIKLSRTFRLEEEGPAPENNAQVKVIGDNGTEYFFTPIGEGIYQSNIQFDAQTGVNYSLEIITQDGSAYASNPSTINGTSVIADFSAKRTFQPMNGIDTEGIAILVDSRSTSTNNSYYRYTYEETYEIRSRYNITHKLVVTADGGFAIVQKEAPDHICYTTKFSKDIILTKTNILTDNNIERSLVHFIDKKSRVTAYRYSILVRQYSLSREAYEFYKILRELSGSESLFSQNQPGFINGNVFSVDNSKEKVLGYFSVSAVDSKRLFFSFSDFFDYSEFPLRELDCSISRPAILNLPWLVESGAVQFIGIPNGNFPDEKGTGPYRVAPSFCIDCTISGTTEVPEFWIE